MRSASILSLAELGKVFKSSIPIVGLGAILARKPSYINYSS